MTARAVSAGALVALALSACSYVDDSTAPYQPPEEALDVPDRGRVLYLQDCAWCHGDAGEGTVRAPDLILGENGAALTHFMLSTGRMPIAAPRERVERRAPDFTPEESLAISEYVASFGGAGPEIPDVDPALGDLARGQQLYNDNCAACHSVSGIGGALGSEDPLTAQIGWRAPPVRGSPTQIVEAMVTGPATMPVFDEDVFTQHDVDSIVRYVEYVQDPAARGGWPLGSVGPVAEGAVAWILGLGLLLAAIRWIGVSTGEET